ncbi:tRNA nucleotidyltransferase, archaeal type [Methanosarcina siciliae T4/M]|uniref:CCA-adding enzyme n=1 Tax=Methanosarcina siciliae T4/M TaxID=1434120 RepID=A0A0E3P2L0_9EURY|nr:CCA tRNA nucleotidyltransferase [Methanosarcina siciliae]AKB27739.1 tRNA nucleotidyltransferase, archaeal type [Methanosarcina siciliae T4/M]
MEKDTSIPEDLKLAVLEKIKPTETERKKLTAVQEELATEVKAAAEKLCVADIFVKMVGSAARGTWLSGTHDIDVFISFPEETSRGELESRGMEIAREVAKKAEHAEDRHAEHPYLNIVFKGFDVDLVPCFRVASACQLKSAVDRTPFHNEFVKTHIKGREDDVLLMKQFMRGGGVYGSELKTQGFSGYLTELLIIHYGSFENTVKAACFWKPGKKIDIMQHSETEHDEPLIMVDPTDPKRNVAAALSLDKFCMFMDHCREFLKNPGLKFFFPPPLAPLEDREFLEKLESRKSSQLAIVFQTPDVVDDVLYPQLYKMEQAAAALLHEYDFSVIKTGVWSGKPETVIMIELISGTLPNVKKRIGPPVWVREHAEKFKAKYEGAENVFGGYIEGGKYVFEVQRKYPTAKGLLEEQLVNCSLGKHVHQSVSKGFEIVEDADVCMLRDLDFRVFLRKWV